jgi:orotate phosphoribosyltransferase
MTNHYSAITNDKMTRRNEIRQKALRDLQGYEVLMLNGHFDFGNGYHGRVYLNPHQLFRHPSTIWRFAQDLLDVIPTSIVDTVEVVAGPVTGGALLAHTIAGLLDSRRDLGRPPTSFAPFRVDGERCHRLSRFYQQQINGRRVLLADDVRNTGQTFARCAALVHEAGGSVVATCEIYDRLEAMVDVGVPNFALAEYRAPENHPADSCPLCQAGVPVTTF